MHKRTRVEIIAGLRDQLAGLESSCQGYDAGDAWEAPRIATIVYNLVYDGKSRTTSILTQLGIRSEMRFVSHFEPNPPGNMVAWAPLVQIHFDQVGPGTGTVSFVPQLNNGRQPPTMVKFSRWWDEPVFENNSGNTLSRKNLIFALRSKDGGSHFDGEIPTSPYLEFRNDGTGLYRTHAGISFALPGQRPPGLEDLPRVRNAHLATMRHIGFELQESIRLFVESRGFNSLEDLE